MQSYVITIMDEPKSVESAQRCIKSAKRHGVNVEMWPAITPKDDPVKIFKDKGLSTRRFENSPYSRPVNAMSAFLSHRSLWEKCCLLYTSPSPRDGLLSRMPSSA